MQTTRIIRTTVALLAALLVVGEQARASVITNGGFETGDLSGWTASPPSLAAVVTLAPALGGGPGDPLVWAPTEGTYFAQLLSGNGAGVYTMLSQSFFGNAGDKLTFDVYFDAGDYLPFNDSGYVSLLDLDNATATILYTQSVSTVGDYGADGWTTVSLTIPTAGNFQIEAGVNNVIDNSFPSALGLDNFQYTPVPEPASLALWSIGAIGTMFVARRKKSLAHQ